MRTIHRLCRAVAWLGVLTVLPDASLAQVPDGEAELEGPIDAIDVDAKIVTIMGVPVKVPSGLADSPTRVDIPLVELTKPGLPGRIDPTFRTATAAATGDIDAGQFVAQPDNIEVEPAENLIAGAITSLPPTFTVQGTPMAALTDLRIPAFPPAAELPEANRAYPALNELGLVVDLTKATKGTLAVAEGYYDQTAAPAPKTFYWHHLTVDAAPLLDLENPQVSIERARCEPGGELQVRGGVYRPTGDPRTGEIQIYDRLPADDVKPLLSTTDLFQVADAKMARYRAELPVGEDCPQKLWATWSVAKPNGNLPVSFDVIVDKR